MSKIRQARNSRELYNISKKYLVDTVLIQVMLDYVETCSSEEQFAIGKALVQFIDSLIVNKLGTLILQIILRCCEDSRAVIYKYCMDNLTSLVTQEHGSRILHTFIEQYDSFRT